ncbi:phosphoribosyl-ATP pyrophosphohydrolase [Sporosarcina sp. P37]|uniref:nucleoside triphosphate pyrophosphohydrolase n=1 Tax=unclassified Sporosarcina TaxID=2647733 RepID=UPI0009BE4744|nr:MULTISPECIES: nucleoside triphosphate pyrophosphohydrolase [unclassified Sporosarcina]ARD48644.1 phosphoribosyl-ATP pyrophosphohydrolase [Sporosarcina sp. P33]ARK25149.1 phosphoribosyl-ATP pyrophosphohydrolase [Sporosarcina sp. P37]PID16265.1 phosphoribosyl-ATP pyrophosphohydrolase [Sporosarcina sp. P35]
MPIYNKLVRDLIPQIIEADGKTCVTQTLNETQYIAELNKKMHEELAEYEEADTAEAAVEELSDLLELIHAAANHHGVTVEELETVRAEKASARGGFTDRIFLVEVQDD